MMKSRLTSSSSSSFFNSFPSILLLSSLFFLLFLLSFPTYTQQYPLSKVPTGDECLYFSDNNNNAKVLSYHNDSRGNESGTLITTLINAGYFPNGITIEGNDLYVASKRFISVYNVTNELSRGPNVVNFAFFNESECIPGGCLSYNDILYVACDDGTPYSILKFSLLPGDNYTFLAGTDGYLSQFAYTFAFTQFEFMEGNFTVWDLLFYSTSTNISGPVGLLVDSGFNIIYMVQLNTTTRTEPLSEVFAFIAPGFTPVPNTLTRETSEVWKQVTVGWDRNLYLVRTYRLPGNIAVGDVIVFDGQTGEFLKKLIPPLRDLANAYGIASTPNNDFLVSVGNDLEKSYIYIFDHITGKEKGIFFQGSEDLNISPQNLYWGPCPSSPPVPSSSGDDTTLIVLATVLPILGTFLLCLMCCLLLILLFLVFSRIYANRRRVYSVRDDLDRIEMGRRGKTVFDYREIDPDDLEIGDLLGQGAFGKVYKGTYRGATVAIKTFDQIKLDEADEETLAEIREEAQMMERLGNHPNVINFVGAITRPTTKGHQLYFSLVTEYCPNGSLYDFLVKKKKKLSLIVLIRMARDIAAGILHLHREKVIHRDIAARNILVGDNYAVYISDFGMARIKQQDVNTTIANVGPIKWMAPECMKYKQYSEASDAFAYGVVLWEMITRKIPWRGLDAAQVVIAVTEKNTRLKVPADADPVLKKIIQAVWRENPEKRMPMAQIVSKLDTYLKTLEEVYEDISSDDEDNPTSQRDYFRVESDGSSIAMTSKGASKKPLRPVKHKIEPDSKVSLSVEDTYATLTHSDSTTLGGPGESALPLRGNNNKHNNNKHNNNNNNNNNMSDENYGTMPDASEADDTSFSSKNYGEIPAEDEGGKKKGKKGKKYTDENYGSMPEEVKKKGK